MEINVGDIISSKKKHVCGSDRWQVERTGADVKLKCAVCGRIIFVSYDELKKMLKNVSGKDNGTL